MGGWGDLDGCGEVILMEGKGCLDKKQYAQKWRSLEPYYIRIELSIL